MNSKYGKLLKNMGLLTISNFGSKVLIFLLVPLYTKILSTSEYGTYDVVYTTIWLVMPIISLNIVESVMRFLLDGNYSKKNIMYIGIKYTLISSFVFSTLVIFNAIFNIAPSFSKYTAYLIFFYLSQAFYILFTQYARGINRVANLAFAGILNTMSTILLNIVFLIIFKMGLDGYFLANIIGLIIPIIYLIIIIRISCKEKIKNNYKSLEREMIAYSTPLILESTSWWGIMASDHLIVTILCGLSENGIYSVAYKIPSILNIFVGVFNQAWVLSIVKEVNNKNYNFLVQTYNLISLFTTVLCSVLIFFNKVIASIMFSGEFYNAWKFAPFLIVSTVFASLITVLGGYFSAIKDSKTIAFTTLCGAIVNMVLNFSLVFSIGPLGAAIATLIAYIIVWYLRLVKIKKEINFKSKSIVKEIFAYILLLLQCVTMLVIEGGLLYIVQGIIVFSIIIINRNELFRILKNLINKMLKNRNAYVK